MMEYRNIMGAIGTATPEGVRMMYILAVLLLIDAAWFAWAARLTGAWWIR